MPTFLRASLALVPILSLLAACSSDTTPADAGPGTQICPVTIEQATAAPDPKKDGTTSQCHVANYICVVGFQCGNFTQQATCTCDGNAFGCVLADGSQVAVGSDTTALCQKIPPPPTDPCPTDNKTADGTPCKNSGQQCYYASTCTSSPPPTDVCQCKGNQLGDAGLSWACEFNCN